MRTGTKLSPAQLEALVLIDGHSTVEQVVKRARNLPIEMLRTSLSELVFKGLLQKTTGDKKARHRRASS